jgi:hypothetical protein
MAIYARVDGMEDCAKVDDGGIRSTAPHEWVVEGGVVVANPLVVSRVLSMSSQALKDRLRADELCRA